MGKKRATTLVGYINRRLSGRFPGGAANVCDMPESHPALFERYIALGDSSTEGVDDPDGAGGYRGWSQRLAEKISAAQGHLQYANLAVRGLTTAQVRATQLDAALAMKPDLATVFCGTNDVTRLRFNAAQVGADVEAMQRALVRSGAKVLSFTLPDLTPVMPLARLIAPRIRALNRALIEASRKSGATLVDFSGYPVTGDLRLWSEDRIHANFAGHTRTAEALAYTLGLPGTDTAWREPFPEPLIQTWSQRCAAEWRWTTRHFLPWMWESITDRSPSLNRQPKRPQLGPI